MDKQNFNIINVLYRKALNRNADQLAFLSFNNLLKKDSSPQIIRKIKEMIIEADRKKIAPYELDSYPDIETKKILLDRFMSSLDNNGIIYLIDDNIKENNDGLRIMKEKKFLIIGLIKNMESHFKNLKKTIENILDNSEQSKFFFLTNNNNDNTITLLKKWKEENQDVDGVLYKDTPCNVLNNNGEIGNRVKVLAQLRNENLRLARLEHGDNFDNLIVVDTDFEEVLDYRMIANSFNLDEDWDIIAGNSVFAYTKYHYDIFALRLLDDGDDINILHPNFKKYYGNGYRWISNLMVFKTFYQVRSAFSSICIINKTAFDHKKLWDENCPLEECEHISMCKKFNKVYVNPQMSIGVGMSNPLKLRNQNNVSTIIDTLFHVPYIFVPRDAGFFSVFNFFIGSLSCGCKVYPYFNRDAIIKLDRKISHFCYLDNSVDNSWFNYFEPINYFSGDDIHEKGLFKKFHLTRGEFSSDLFKYPQASQKNYKRKDFYEWRCKINNIFKNYIKIKPHIVKKVDRIHQSFKKKMIAVHFRHPSHSCEQGTIYLRDYFTQIDKIFKVENDVAIFLATDTDFGIAAFSMRYSDKIIYNKECDRTSMDNFLSWVYDSQKHKADEFGFLNGIGYELHNEKSGKNNNSTSFGEDVLLDVILLSKCNWLIHTISNLSLAVSYWNPHCEMILLDNETSPCN